MKQELWWSDFLLEAEMSQCTMCGALEPDATLVNVQLDEPGCWARVCQSCREGLRDAWDV